MSTAATSKSPSKIPTDKLLRLYKQMVAIRLFEERVNDLYTRALMPGLAHLYIGEEAIAVGVCEALTREDYITSTHRGHGHCLAKGATPDRMFAELLGKEAGYCKGKGGSMHIADPDTGNLGANAIVGGSAGIATGAGLSIKMRKSNQVAVCFFGDGALGQGLIYESMNMAQLWKVPCIYICENNQYGMGTSLKRAMSVLDISQKSCAYDIAAEFVDGMDVLAVREATLRAVERARKDYLPTLLEVRTYRFMGHSMSDPGNYRTRAEIEQHQERDPIKLFTASLKEEGVMSDTDFQQVEARVKEQVEEAVRVADESPLPDPSELYTDIYATPLNEKHD